MVEKYKVTLDVLLGLANYVKFLYISRILYDSQGQTHFIIIKKKLYCTWVNENLIHFKNEYLFMCLGQMHKGIIVLTEIFVLLEQFLSEEFLYE